MVRDTIALLLEEEYQIHLATSAGSALAILRAPTQRSIDLILLDCLLPEGNVAEVLAEADERFIPVVLISGDLRQQERFGPDRRFLAKPFTQGTLLEILDSARR